MLTAAAGAINKQRQVLGHALCLHKVCQRSADINKFGIAISVLSSPLPLVCPLQVTCLNSH